VGQINLTATDVALPGGTAPAGHYASGTLTLNFMSPISSIAPPPAADLLGHPSPSLNAAIARSLQVVAQENLPAPLAQQLASIKAPFEVSSVTSATQPNGILTLAPTRAFSPGVAGATIIVDSGPAVGGTAVPLIITETGPPPGGFALDTRPQTIPVGFDSCAPLTAAPPAPGSPMWTVTKTSGALGLVETATLRDALAAVVVPPVTTPPVTPPVTTPPVVPPVTTPPVTPPVTTPPVVPPVVTTPPVVTPVIPAPVVTPAPVIPAPVVTPAPAPAGVAIAVPVAPAPSVTSQHFAPPRGVDAGLAPAADQSSGTGQRALGALLGLTGLTGLAGAGGLIARRRRQS